MLKLQNVGMKRRHRPATIAKPGGKPVKTSNIYKVTMEKKRRRRRKRGKHECIAQQIQEKVSLQRGREKRKWLASCGTCINEKKGKKSRRARNP